VCFFFKNYNTSDISSFVFFTTLFSIPFFSPPLLDKFSSSLFTDAISIGRFELNEPDRLYLPLSFPVVGGDGGGIFVFNAICTLCLSSDECLFVPISAAVA